MIMNSINNFLKRVFDIVFSVLLLLALLPFFIFIAIAILIDSKGPIFFKQPRLGLKGKVFNIYKFRSMVVGAERMGTGLFNYSNDPRVTKVGRFLRDYSLDELPQLFNILKGDMSFVGPRPPVTYELGDYKNFDGLLKQRFIMKPGVTGLAQINGRNELSWDEKIVFDNKYITDFRRFGILLDIKILFITVFKVLRNEGSHELEKNAEKDMARINNKAQNNN
ncbi:MAG TPA: sugar transferase [Tenuifilaceae bacterium]|nr:sugar transferase [Tenuifilaceae bacterium]